VRFFLTSSSIPVTVLSVTSCGYAYIGLFVSQIYRKYIQLWIVRFPATVELMAVSIYVNNRVTTCLENLEMSGNLKHVREMSGKKNLVVEKCPKCVHY